jgi:molybdopterin-synthase adenylyltransferase
MYIKFQNSCTYCIKDNVFTLRSILFDKIYQVKSLNSDAAKNLFNQLIKGTLEADLFIDIPKKDISQAQDLISFLFNKGFIVRSKTLSPIEPTYSLYDRQIRFLDTYENNEKNGVEINNKLQNHKIVIVGLGAYGSWLSLHCARIGIKNITAIDFDKVELSNLPRQIIYSHKDIGRFKTDACKDFLISADPTINYEGHCVKITNADELKPFLECASLVFNAFGYYPEHQAINLIPGYITRACIETATPMLCLSTNWLGPFYIPKLTGCYYCAVTNPSLAPILESNHRNPRIDKRAFGPILATTCSVAVLEATSYLSGIKPPKTMNGIFMIDPFNIDQSNYFPVEVNPHCHHCQTKLTN